MLLHNGKEVVTTVSDELTELVPRVNFERRRANCWPPFFYSKVFNFIFTLFSPFFLSVFVGWLDLRINKKV